MSGVHAEHAFEAGIASRLIDGGWLHGHPAAFDRRLGLAPDDLFSFIDETQRDDWEELVRRHGGDPNARTRFLQRLTTELDRRGTVDVLRRGMNDQGKHIRLCFFRPASRLTDELNARYKANRCTVVRQLRYDPDNDNELDLVLLVNGIPVATAELKNPLTRQRVAHAKHQYDTDRDPRNVTLGRRALVHFAVDPDEAWITTRLAGQRTRWLEFNQGSGGPGKVGGRGNPRNSSGYRTAYLWEHVWQRDAWLEILQRFIHIEKPKGGTERIIFPRYHQWDLVRRLVADARARGAGHNYLAQHSAGSGKSNSIAWTAHQLASLHNDADEKVFDKVIVVTDRVVLDDQLQKTIFQFDHVPGVVERITGTSTQLAEALRSTAAQIVITTIQKFPVILSSADQVSGRFAVIVDEAHSSQTGESARALKGVLSGVAGGADALEAAEVAQQAEEAVEEDPVLAAVASRGHQDNLSFFAFTATPKNKTLQLFGMPGADGLYRPFHIYSMRQAIEEKYIFDVLANYVTYKTYFKLAKTKAEDRDVDKAKAAKAIARFKDLHPSNLAQRAEIVVEHFRRVTRHKVGGKGKAMVVTRSRLHAVKFKQTVDAYLARKGYTDMQVLVAFSPGKFDPDRPGALIVESEFNLMSDGTGLRETALPQYFEETDEAGLLIVAEKYQTGFDQPLLHTMYVDKKLEGVKAVQTLSRLNRTCPGKDDTFILDFENTVEHIQDAFRPFYEATLAEPTDPNLVYDTWAAIEEYAVIDPADTDAFARVFLADPNPRNHPLLYGHLEGAIGRWQALADDDAREEFRRRLQGFVRLYAFIAQVVPFSDPDLERAYLYCRFLALRLPTLEQRGIDLTGELELTHLRIELTGEHNASLGAGTGEEVMPGFTGTGEGHTVEPVAERLSTIIATLNERFGLELTEADKLTFDQWVESAIKDNQLAEQARANTKDNFRFGFEERFENIVMDSHDRATELFDRFLADGAFAAAVRGWALDEAYRRLRHDKQRN